MPPSNESFDLDAYVEQILTEAPPLDDEQLQRIAALLITGNRSGGDAA